MASTKEDIASAALQRLGENPISSFTENTDIAATLQRLYEPTILSLFSQHEWNFANVRATLAVDGAAPASAYKFGYLMPTLGTDRAARPIRVFNSAAPGARPVGDWVQTDRWVFTNHATCIISYVQRKPESLWPGYFEMLAIEAVAAFLAMPVTETVSIAQEHGRVAFGTASENGRGGLFGIAVLADKSAEISESVLDFNDPIAQARWGGG